MKIKIITRIKEKNVGKKKTKIKRKSNDNFYASQRR